MSEHLWIDNSLISKLENFLTGSEERVGFVLKNGDIVECLNICTDPEQGFDVSDADLVRYCDEAVATWHTHPGATKQLSVGDYETFRVNDELIHFIIGTDGVGAYQVEEGFVLNMDLPE